MLVQNKTYVWTIQLSNFTCFQKGLSSFGKKESVGFQAKCAYWWAVTVLFWLLKKICLQKSALDVVFESPEVNGLRTFCQIRTRHHWAFWKCPVPTECKANLIHLRTCLSGCSCPFLEHGSHSCYQACYLGFFLWLLWLWGLWSTTGT